MTKRHDSKASRARTREAVTDHRPGSHRMNQLPPSNPNDEPLTLDRWHAERRDHHRAMLLWAMQGPDLRSQRKVSRATGASESTIRNWRRARMWEQRCAHHGKHADQYALDLYRSEYMADFGKIEMPWVLPNIVRTVGGVDLDDPASVAAEQARERARKATGATVAEVEQAARQAVADRKRNSKTEADKHIRLVDGALGLLARKMKANEIRVSVRDIPVLLECRERLTRVVAGAEDGTGRVVQSARVRHAKETGGDLLEAMYVDAEEVVLILGALRTRRTEDVYALSQQDAEHREQVGA